MCTLIHVFCIILQISEGLDAIADKAVTSSLIIIGAEDINNIYTYYLIIEKKVLVSGILRFSKALMLWCSAHYIFNLEYQKTISEVALFIQELVFGLPAVTIKKSATYLTVSSNIQCCTAA